MVNDVTTGEDNKLFLPTKILQLYGCKNCIWKNYGQCPKSFTKVEDSVPEGYCTEFGSFILSLGNPGDSTSAIMEKYLTYTQQVQALADNSELHQAVKRLKEFKSTDHITLSKEEINKQIAKMEMEIVSSKIWWSRLTDSVVKNLARIVDRESRSKDIQQNKQLKVMDINLILQDSAKVLLENDKEKKEL